MGRIKMYREDINGVLTKDILTEILYRLPCKSVIHCKCVCKHWNSIISTPSFIRHCISHKVYESTQEQLTFFESMGSLFITRHHLGDFRFSLPLKPFILARKTCRVIDSCNGLVLCSILSKLDEIIFYVCNPFTKQCIAIPPLPRTSHKLDNDVPTGFICDPFYQQDDHGGVVINYDRRFRIYRFCGTTSYEEKHLDLDIYSSETGKWNNVKVSRQKNFKRGMLYSQRRIIPFSGKLYMLLGWNLIVFDPTTNEICGDIDLPDDGEALGAFQGLSCSTNSLWICQNCYPRKTLRIWKLKERTSDTFKVPYWSLERVIVLQDDYDELTKETLVSGRILAVHPQCPDILLMNLWWGPRSLWNLKTGVITDVGKNDKYHVTCANAFLLEVPRWPTPIPEIRGAHEMTVQ